jgi:hypothetical protein
MHIRKDFIYLVQTLDRPCAIDVAGRTRGLPPGISHRPPDDDASPGRTHMADDNDPVPLCPHCERSMQRDRVTPRSATAPERHTFVCASCRETLTISEGEED